MNLRFLSKVCKPRLAKTASCASVPLSARSSFSFCQNLTSASSLFAQAPVRSFHSTNPSLGSEEGLNFENIQQKKTNKYINK